MGVGEKFIFKNTFKKYIDLYIKYVNYENVFGIYPKSPYSPNVYISIPNKSETQSIW